jgi:hypothetical protein
MKNKKKTFFRPPTPSHRQQCCCRLGWRTFKHGIIIITFLFFSGEPKTQAQAQGFVENFLHLLLILPFSFRSQALVSSFIYNKFQRQRKRKERVSENIDMKTWCVYILCCVYYARLYIGKQYCKAYDNSIKRRERESCSSHSSKRS